MTVRLFHPSDWEDIRRGATEFATKSGLGDFLPGDPEGLHKALAGIILDPTTIFLVAEDQGRVVGRLCLHFTPFLWNSERIVANELFFFVFEDAPKSAALSLLRAARDKAKEMGATVLSLSALETSPEAVRKVYSRMGLKSVESRFLGNL